MDRSHAELPMIRVALCAAIAAIGLTGCSKPEHTEAVAIDMARQKMLRLSRELKDHVPIHSDELTVTDVKKDEHDEGWCVTLVEGDCKYIVYAEPGHGLMVVA